LSKGRRRRGLAVRVASLERKVETLERQLRALALHIGYEEKAS